MSYRHYILESIHFETALDSQLEQAVDHLVMEHQTGNPSIEERCARAEALALLALEMLRRRDQ